MMKQLSCVLFALGISAGCTVNGKPLFGFGSKTPSSGPAAAQPAAAQPSTTTAAAPTTSTSQPSGDTAKPAPAAPTTPAAPAVADGTKTLEDIGTPDKTAPFQGWTAVQQWMPYKYSEPRFQYGYGNLSGAVVLADELGPQLSHLGRASLLEVCFKGIKEDATAAIAWAVCGGDAKAFDIKKAEAELVKEGVKKDVRVEVLAQAKAAHDKATKIGAAVEAAAKDDPGLAKVLGLAETARTEWSAFASKNADAVDRYRKLKDAVRSGKSNHKDFAGCYDATYAPFAKLVKATKYPWDEEGDILPFYISYLVTTPAGYVHTVSYAACAWSQDASGESIYAAAANQEGGHVRIGERSLTLAKIMDETFEPKFADRSLNLSSMRFQWKYGIKMSGINDITAIMTPGGGKLASVKKDGDVARLSFKADKVESCLQWRDTNRVSNVSSNGSVSYQRECVKRGMVDNQEGEIKAPLKYSAGLAPGVNVTTVNNFPVVAWKDGKWIAILGVAI